MPVLAAHAGTLDWIGGKPPVGGAAAGAGRPA